MQAFCNRKPNPNGSIISCKHIILRISRSSVDGQQHEFKSTSEIPSLAFQVVGASMTMSLFLGRTISAEVLALIRTVASILPSAADEILNDLTGKKSPNDGFPAQVIH